MNCLNPQRNKEVEPRRAFGKDITNIAKGHQGDNQLKKGLVAVVTQSNHIGVKLRQPNDAINDYHQQIFAFISTYPQKAVGQACGEVTDKMRQILVDWLVEVHQSFKLKDQTLFLALQYLQEYQSLISISKEQYQLVGIACLWIASKHEEIYPPRMKEFVDVTACTYNRTQLMAMEGKIIQVMQFNLNRVTPLALLSTLELPSFGNAENARSLSLAQYVLELSYLGGSVPRKYSLKTMVMAAVKLGDAVCKKDTNMGYFTCELGDSQFYACHKELALLLQVENKYKLTAIKRKYQKEKYNCVGKISIKYQN